MSEVSAKENGVPVVDDGNNLPGDVETDEPDVLGFGSSSAGFRNRKSVAKMSVDAGALFYKMTHKKRGVCLILNNEKFFVPGLKDRSGTQADRDNLRKTFKDLGFEVITHDNLTCSATIKEVKEVAERDHSDCDCFVMCVLSHGEEGVIFATDAPYKHDQIFNPFTADNCPTLAGKPKMFFLQACQGSRLDAGLTMATQVDSSPSYKIPVHADFLVAYSTIPGFYSWRNTGKGSWFVQALVLELQESGMLYDILTLLTFVNRRVAIDFESNVPDNTLMHAKKQVPFITFMLTRLVKFSFKEPS
uniref:Caspase-1 n=2 Tax=Lygus hesperus TaxID=30085 RepID=A0A146KLZ1_LYGHE